MSPGVLSVDLATSGVSGVPGSYWVVRGVGDRALAGMPVPSSEGVWGALVAAGFSNIVCLTAKDPPYDPAPLIVNGFPLEDLIGGGAPSDPLAEATILHQAVSLVLELMSDGQRVVVHCYGGRGRTGTVVGAALVALGHAPGTVAEWLDDVHRGRDRGGWPESDWQRAVLEDFHDGTPRLHHSSAGDLQGPHPS
jgi:hypothetical protein